MSVFWFFLSKYVCHIFTLLLRLNLQYIFILSIEKWQFKNPNNVFLLDQLALSAVSCRVFQFAYNKTKKKEKHILSNLLALLSRIWYKITER